MIRSIVPDEKKDNRPKNNTACKYCKSPSIERIPRGTFVKVFFSYLPVRHFICYNCLRKQYKMRKF